MSTIPVSLQIQVTERSPRICSYCQSQQRITGVTLTFDHIIPQSLGGETNLENLCLACWDCNLAKADRTTAIDPQTGVFVRLFHPVQQRWHDHFSWSEGGRYIVGITSIGRATVIALKLNRPQLVESRTYWNQAGWHPPAIE